MNRNHQTIDIRVASLVLLLLVALAGLLFFATKANAQSASLYEVEVLKLTVAQTALEIKSDDGNRHFHYDCEVDAAEAGTIYIGESDVSSTNYGKHRVAEGEWGGPHGGEYVVASGAESIIVRCRLVVGVQ